MTRIKVASFNVENLFGRAKVLNFFDHENGSGKLAKIAQLEVELKRAVYNKPRIIELYQEVRDVIRFNVTRSDVGRYIVANHNRRLHVFPDGAKDWAGTIEFKREKFNDEACRNTAKVIRGLKADILCIIEAEDRPSLKSFNGDRLGRMFPHNLLIDGNDQRGIDVGLYSKFPIGNVRTNIFDGSATSRTFPRDCLEAEIETPDGPIYLLINHFTSKMRGGEARRKRQADRVRAILQERYDLVNQRVIIAGDLNDTPESAQLRPLTGHPHLTDVLARQFPGDPSDRWTYHYEKNEQIDYILVSEPLAAGFHAAGVERRGIADVDEYTDGRIKPFKNVTNWRDAASDHGAVWAEFDI